MDKSMDAQNCFNYCTHFFASHRFAAKCGYLRQSKIILDMQSMYPISHPQARYFSASNNFSYPWNSNTLYAEHFLLKRLNALILLVFSAFMHILYYCHLFFRGAIADLFVNGVAIVVAFYLLLVHFMLYSITPLFVCAPVGVLCVVLIFIGIYDHLSTQQWLRYRFELYRFGAKAIYRKSEKSRRNGGKSLMHYLLRCWRNMRVKKRQSTVHVDAKQTATSLFLSPEDSSEREGDNSEAMNTNDDNSFLDMQDTQQMESKSVRFDK